MKRFKNILLICNMDSLLAGIDLMGIITHKHLIRNDDAGRAIIKLVRNKKVDLLVIGTVCVLVWLDFYR